MTRKRAKKGQQTRICEKDYLKNLVALCPDGIIAVNRFGTVTLFNRAAEELIGHKARDVVGKANITDVYKSEQIARDVKKAIYADTFGGAGQFENYEVELEGRQGKKIPIRLSAVLIVKNGEEVGSVRFDPVTLSIGVTQALSGESGEEVIQRADLAMYDAKRNGGDQVAAAQNVNRS